MGTANCSKTSSLFYTLICTFNIGYPLLLADATMKSKVTEIESSLSNTKDFLSSQIQMILVNLDKLTEAFKKLGSSDPICNAGWTQYGLSCYYLSSDYKSWNASKEDCEDKNAHLVVINDAREMNFLNKWTNTTNLWIGLTNADGSWKWVDGTPYDKTPTFWSEGQPDDWKSYYHGEGEDCVEISINGTDWNDNHCSKELLYICEKKIFWI